MKKCKIFTRERETHIFKIRTTYTFQRSKDYEWQDNGFAADNELLIYYV